jgi:hypothetical protein
MGAGAAAAATGAGVAVAAVVVVASLHAPSSAAEEIKVNSKVREEGMVAPVNDCY